MDDGGRLSWLIIVFTLVILAFVFALIETAFASVSRTRLKVLTEKGNLNAKKALNITDNFDSAITTILICTNIIHILAASIVTINVTKLWGLSWVTISTVVFTLVIFFFGEMLPKSIARKYSERVSLSTAGFLSLCMKIFGIFANVLTWIGEKVASLTKGEGEVSVTEDELYDIIEDLTEEGTLDEEQGDLISSALSFQDISVESILTARVDVVALNVDSTTEEVLEVIKNEAHSRLPVFEGTIDKIIGTLQIRKYLKAYLAHEDVSDLRKLIDEPFFIHQSTMIDDLLESMSKEKSNIAIVTDNYGGTLGIVTVEDILEELVGEIWDEDDLKEENIIQITDNLYSVDASDLVTDILDDLDIDYDEEEEEKIENKLMSELAFENFIEIPKEGDSFEYLNTKITIQEMKDNRILRVKVKIYPEEEASDE